MDAFLELYFVQATNADELLETLIDGIGQLRHRNASAPILVLVATDLALEAWLDIESRVAHLRDVRMFQISPSTFSFPHPLDSYIHWLCSTSQKHKLKSMKGRV